MGKDVTLFAASETKKKASCCLASEKENENMQNDKLSLNQELLCIVFGKMNFQSPRAESSRA